MADVKDLVTPIRSAIEALGSSPTELPDEYRRTHRIPPAGVRYQLRLEQIAETESAASEVHRAVARATVRIWARPASLATYSRVTMLDDQESLYAPEWWRAIAGVYNCSEPREEEPPTLFGPVLVYAMRVELHVNL